MIGVTVDMIVGTISFQKNGKDWGVAFKSEEFTRGSLFPAVAPIYVKDEYTIKLPHPED